MEKLYWQLDFSCVMFEFIRQGCMCRQNSLSVLGNFHDGEVGTPSGKFGVTLGEFSTRLGQRRKIQWYSPWISSNRWCNVGNLNLQLGNLSDRWCCVGNSKLWNLQLGNLSDRWCCVGNSKLWYYSLSGARKIVSVSWPLVGTSPISGVPRGATSTPD